MRSFQLDLLCRPDVGRSVGRCATGRFRSKIVGLDGPVGRGENLPSYFVPPPNPLQLCICSESKKKGNGAVVPSV